MNSEIKGIVLKAKPFDNKDMLLTVYSEQEGKINILAKNVRGSKKTQIYAQQFCLAEFELFKGSSISTVNQARVIETFYDLRFDIETLAIAQYLSELVSQIPYGMISGEEKELLSLFLNTLFLLCKNKDNSVALKKIKMVFELRFSKMNGYEPAISNCIRCGSEDIGFWNYEKGMFCKNCGANEYNTHKINNDMIKAMKYMLNEDLAVAYRFSMNNDALIYLCSIVENYVINVFGTNFNSLDYYRSIDTLNTNNIN